MNISQINKKECTGCMACSAICPKKCIVKSLDNEKFIVPKVIEDQCINCGLCLKKCPANNKAEVVAPMETYAGQVNTIEILINSASGGIAHTISSSVIESGGIVYGCEMDKKFKIKHSRCDTLEDLSKFQKSKYIQSDIQEIYKEIDEDLKNEKIVLFIGTPCQVEGVKMAFKCHENLYTIDLVCHGVPNQSLLDMYIDYLNNKRNSVVNNFNFRSKENSPWIEGANIKIEYSDKIKYISQHCDPFGSSFFFGENLRESCYKCKYSTKERAGDITVSDFWGVDKIKSSNKFDYNNGVSAIMVNTDKGKKLLEKIKDKIILECVSFADIELCNPNLKEPTYRPKIRDSYYERLNRQGISFLERRMYLRKDYWYFKIKGKIPPKIKKSLKKFRRNK